MDEEPKRDLIGLVIKSCDGCTRWVHEGMHFCCTPCAGGGKYPHDWLCSKIERERRNYPRETFDPEAICPRCDKGLSVLDQFYPGGPIMKCSRCDRHERI